VYWAPARCRVTILGSSSMIGRPVFGILPHRGVPPVYSGITQMGLERAMGRPEGHWVGFVRWYGSPTPSTWVRPERTIERSALARLPEDFSPAIGKSTSSRRLPTWSWRASWSTRTDKAPRGVQLRVPRAETRAYGGQLYLATMPKNIAPAGTRERFRCIPSTWMRRRRAPRANGPLQPNDGAVPGEPEMNGFLMIWVRLSWRDVTLGGG